MVPCANAVEELLVSIVLYNTGGRDTSNRIGGGRTMEVSRATSLAIFFWGGGV